MSRAPALDGSVPPGLTRALAAYPGLANAEIERLPGGLLHASLAVSAEVGEYIVQCINPVFSPAIHRNISEVTRHLAEHGLATLRLVATRDGEDFVDLGPQGRWRLLTRLPGRTFEQCEVPALAASAGALVGRFHAALLDFDAPLEPLGFPYHDTPAHFEDLTRAMALHADHRHAAAVAEIAETAIARAAQWHDLDELPRRVIHGDLKFSNVLFERDGEVAGVDQSTGGWSAASLIDLDTLSRLPLYYDLGDAWRSWCNRRGESEAEANLDIGIFEASARGYLDAFGDRITKEELESLAESIERVSLELCVRFAADTLLESYFAWDAGRFESAGDHNLARARGQLSLSQQARARHADLLHFLRS
jgi:Ser/Thr protein kinase RdoA (MazF antagonist)